MRKRQFDSLWAILMVIALLLLPGCVLRTETVSGPPGEAGPRGERGAIGPMGAAGPQGPKGESQWTTSASGIYYDQGGVGIGESNPWTALHVRGIPQTDTGSRYVAVFSDSSPMAMGVGAGMVFSGQYSTAGNDTTFAALWATKADGVDGNFGGELHLGARRNGGGVPNDITIDQAGNVGIGTSIPMTTLDVNGTARLAKYSSPPVVCDQAHDGTIALNHLTKMCVCDGTTWRFVKDDTACSW